MQLPLKNVMKKIYFKLSTNIAQIWSIILI